MFDWFFKQRESHISVNCKALKAKALGMANSLMINQTTDMKFKASRGWIRNWMSRYSVAWRKTTHVGQKWSSSSLNQAKKSSKRID